MSDHQAETDQNGGCVPCRVCGGDQTRGWHLHDRAPATETAQVVLGQIGEHVEPGPCRECGKSASACGRAGSFCCPSCAGEPGVAGTSFLTHEQVYSPATTDGSKVADSPEDPECFICTHVHDEPDSCGAPGYDGNPCACVDALVLPPSSSDGGGR